MTATNPIELEKHGGTMSQNNSEIGGRGDGGCDYSRKEEHYPPKLKTTTTILKS